VKQFRSVVAELVQTTTIGFFLTMDNLNPLAGGGWLVEITTIGLFP